tara:strand:+ start:14689 stop:16629 length:1941 start_codon:yes stop_codon:yes gene_type:complete
MGLDTENDYKNAKSKIKSYQTTVETKKNETKAKLNSSADNFEKAKDKNFSNLNEWGDTVDGFTAEKKKQLQDKAKNQLDQLTEIFMISSSKGGGNKGVDELFDIYNQTILNTKSRIQELFIQEIITAAGCSEEQEFVGQPLYIRVPSIDLYKKLYEDPDGDTTQLLYEKNTTPNGSAPYSMNRELYHRLQNVGIPFSTNYGLSYIGASNNPIFDIEYVTVDANLNQGDYYKVTPINPGNGVKSITQFLQDYYTSINLFEIDELITIIMNMLTGAISVDLNIGIDTEREQSKFEKVMQRILGLCFDNTKEIDVSGIAKLSVSDNLDDSFFELTDNELRTIENELDNIQNGVTEFTDCNNVKLPIDTGAIINGIKNVRDENNETKKIEAFKSLIDDLSNNEEWKLLLPNLNIEGSIKFDLLGIMPKAILQALLSPKNLLGVMIVFKMVQNQIADKIDTLQDFLKYFKNFIVELMSKIGAIFVEELFKEIKKNLNALVMSLIENIARESKNAQARMIFSIINTVIIVADLVTDWRQCKSVVDELLQLLSLAASKLNLGLPASVLSLASFLPGMSETRTLANIIEELQKSGIPTGDMPDGSPNLFVQSMSSQINGQQKEMQENGKTEITIPPLAVVGGTTLPVKASGKSY